MAMLKNTEVMLFYELPDIGDALRVDIAPHDVILEGGTMDAKATGGIFR